MSLPHVPNVISGAPASTLPLLDVHDPSTGTVIARVPLSGAHELDLAVQAALRAAAYAKRFAAKEACARPCHVHLEVVKGAVPGVVIVHDDAEVIRGAGIGVGDRERRLALCDAGPRIRHVHQDRHETIASGHRRARVPVDEPHPRIPDVTRARVVRRIGGQR